MKTSSRFARNTLSLLIAAAFVSPCAAFAQSDSDEKIRKLEEGIESLKRELEEVKGQLQDNKDKTAQTEQRLDSQGVQARFNEGVVFEDPRGDWGVRMSGRVQLDYKHYDQDSALADDFSMRRIRLGVGANLYKDYTVYVEGDFASGDSTGTTQQTMRATLAYIDIGWWKPARIRLGQFKPGTGSRCAGRPRPSSAPPAPPCASSGAAG